MALTYRQAKRGIVQALKSTNYVQNMIEFKDAESLCEKLSAAWVALDEALEIVNEMERKNEEK